MPQHVVAVVDEDRRFLGRVREQLGRAGYLVRPFHSPKSAYALLSGPPPDAIIVGVERDANGALEPEASLAVEQAGFLRVKDTDGAAGASRLRQYEQHLSGGRRRVAWMLLKPLDIAVVLQILSQTLDRLEREVQ